MIPLTGCHWRSNSQDRGRIPLTDCHWGSINKMEVRIPLTGCRWGFNYQKEGWEPIYRLPLGSI
jgi:hypothetical protein